MKSPKFFQSHKNPEKIPENVFIIFPWSVFEKKFGNQFLRKVQVKARLENRKSGRNKHLTCTLIKPPTWFESFSFIKKKLLRSYDS